VIVDALEDVRRRELASMKGVGVLGVALQDATAAHERFAEAAAEDIRRGQTELAARNEGYGDDECKICYQDVVVTLQHCLPCDKQHWICVPCLHDMTQSARRCKMSVIVCPMCYKEASSEVMSAVISAEVEVEDESGSRGEEVGVKENPVKEKQAQSKRMSGKEIPSLPTAFKKSCAAAIADEDGASASACGTATPSRAADERLNFYGMTREEFVVVVLMMAQVLEGRRSAASAMS